MPNRILKESICTSENIDKLSAFNETVFYRLIVNCDDFGRLDARPKILASRLFPLKDIRAAQIENALRALTSAELVTLYEVNGKPFLQMNTWDRHQQIRAAKSKFPGPEDGLISTDISCNQMISNDINCKQMQANVPVIQSNRNRNPIRESGGAPTLEEVTEYCRERNSPVDPVKFWTYFNEGGWRDAKGNPVRNWKQKVLTWEKFDQEKKPSQVTASMKYDRDINALLKGMDEL